MQALRSTSEHPLPYPEQATARDRWILSRRPQRNRLDPLRPWAFLVEEEPDADGRLASVTTIFLTNRECPWRCAMCDLWRNTLVEKTPPGAIPAQIDFALGELPAISGEEGSTERPKGEPGPRHIKLYNSGSFFDPNAIPPQDHAAIAQRLQSFDRVIVENHPALVNDSCLRLRDLLAAGNPSARLEVAMGLETAHPAVLEKLNKRLTLDGFAAAAAFLRANEIALRVFILVQPPFLPPEESLHWAQRSLDFAFASGAAAATLIPTRAGNGAMEALAAAGAFTPPALDVLEAALDYGLGLKRGRVFADLWDLPRTIDCPACGLQRTGRLRQMNRTQQILPRIPCERCGGQG